MAAFGFLALALASCRPADDAATSVATDAAPSRADAPARAQEEPRAAQAPASDLLIGGWVLVTYQAESGFEEAVAANERYTIEFTADGRVSGLADCNRYTGAYSEPAPGRLAMGANMAVTMAACWLLSVSRM